MVGFKSLRARHILRVARLKSSSSSLPPSPPIGCYRGQLCRAAIKAVERYNQVIHLSESRKRGWLEINRFPEIIFRSALRWPRWESEGTFCQTMKKIGRCHLRWEIRSFSELCSELRTTLSRHFDAQKQTFKKMMIENFLFFTVVTVWHACCPLSCGR